MGCGEFGFDPWSGNYDPTCKTALPPLKINEKEKRFKNQPAIVLPPETMIGSLSRYIADESVKDFQPMGANMGILPPLSEAIRDKRERAAAYSQRALKRLWELFYFEQ